MRGNYKLAVRNPKFGFHLFHVKEFIFTSVITANIFRRGRQTLGRCSGRQPSSSLRCTTDCKDHSHSSILMISSIKSARFPTSQLL